MSKQSKFSHALVYNLVSENELPSAFDTRERGVSILVAQLRSAVLLSAQGRLAAKGVLQSAMPPRISFEIDDFRGTHVPSILRQLGDFPGYYGRR